MHISACVSFVLAAHIHTNPQHERKAFTHCKYSQNTHVRTHKHRRKRKFGKTSTIKRQQYKWRARFKWRTRLTKKRGQTASDWRHTLLLVGCAIGEQQRLAAVVSLSVGGLYLGRERITETTKTFAVQAAWATRVPITGRKRACSCVSECQHNTHTESGTQIYTQTHSHTRSECQIR